MLKALLFLPLLALSLLVQAQGPDPINLQTATLPLIPGGVPVDVGVIQHTRGLRSTYLVVPTQGLNNVDLYLEFRPHQFGQLLSPPYSVQTPLSLLVMRLDSTSLNQLADDFVVLTADGNVVPWLYNGSSFRAGAPIALRQGQPCAPTDRLLAGKYIPGGTGLDLACLSMGPLPGFAQAQSLGNGVFQVAPRNTLRAVDSATVMATANMFNDPRQLEDALVPLSREPQGAFTFWRHTRNATGTSSWLFTRAADVTSTLDGHCVSVAPGDVNGDGMMDVAAAGRQLAVHLGAQNMGSYIIGPTAETYSLLPQPLEVRLADLTGDNRPEMLVLCADNTVNIFYNTSSTGPMLFAALPYVYAVGPDPAILRVADADDDGDLDVLVPCRGNNTVSILWNDLIPLATKGTAPPIQVDAYPNPATTALHLRWSGYTRASEATLLDLAGREVRRWPIVAVGTALPVADLPRGLYLLRVHSGGSTVSRRIVLQ